jgi:hypothetical protein
VINCKERFILSNAEIQAKRFSGALVNNGLAVT